MHKDFTLSIYRQLLLALQQAEYSFFTFEDYCKKKPSGKYVILRHDVDLKAAHSLATAKIESEMGIRASYYFRVILQSNQPNIIRQIADFGHEIGYHYEDLSLFSGDEEKAFEHFKKQLNYFRQFYNVQTICMHGSPTSKFDNRDIWKKYDYKELGIIGEPYFDFLNLSDILYFTDTARMWDGDKYNIRDKAIENHKPKIQVHTTDALINWIKASNNNLPIMITTHPQRWTNSTVEWIKELFIQRLKNIVKRFLYL